MSNPFERTVTSAADPAVGDDGVPSMGLALLHQYQRPDFFMASPRHTLLAQGVHAAVPHGSSPLESRVRAALRQAAGDGLDAPVVVGAVPFDARRPAALRVARSWRRADPLLGLVPASRAPQSCAVRQVPEAEVYAAGVAEAVRRIRAGLVDKVVLARTLEVDAGREPDLRALLTRLAARNALGYTFAVPLGAGRTLVGASPELLVSRRNGVLLANPLAGSLPRSSDPAEDARRAQALLRSPKDLEEHRIVVEAVVQALRPLCPELEVPEGPSLVHTAAMWHLSTEITGRTEADALTLALALHPTPAVCGHPRAAAHALIGEIEPFDRGFYAGAFGWSDAQGDGEWVVALRCAEVDGARLRLYAGAGVVGDSRPEAEVAETAAKFRTMLDALGLAHEVAQPLAREVA